MSNTPQIRFAGFTDAWEQRELRTAATFSKGSSYSKNDLKENGTPIILYGRLYTKYETVISEVDTFVDVQPNSVYSTGHEVIVPASGETAEDISRASFVAKSGILLGGDLNIIVPDDYINPVFLALTISNGNQQKELSKRAQGKSVVHIHNSDLENVVLLYPKYEEQEKIGEYFSKLDTLITLHQREYFSFDFSGESAKTAQNTISWEQRKLSDLIIEYKETVDSECDLPVLTSSKTEGVVLQEEHFGRKQQHDITGYNILPRGYCTYRNRSDGVDFTFNINKCCDKGIISKFYPVFYGNNSDVFFISLVLNHSEEVVHEIGYTCTGTGQKVLSFLDLLKMHITVPSYDEQKKIASYFEQLDTLITLHQRKLETLQKMKKSLLQKMFV